MRELIVKNKYSDTSAELSNKHAALEEEILFYVECYRPLMGLDNWDIEVWFQHTNHIADAEANDEYQNGILTFDLDKVAKNYVTHYSRSKLVRHELGHCIVWPCSAALMTLAEMLGFKDYDKNIPLRDIIEKAEERTTTWIDSMSVWDLVDPVGDWIRRQDDGDD